MLLTHLVLGHVRTHGGGRVFISPIEVRFSDNDVVQPDNVLVGHRDLRIITPDRIDGVPTWIVEVLSDPTVTGT